jgi:tartrate-resistant acid phosphatase type 5
VRVFGVAVGGTGDEDDDWFFTYFQPYRYVLNRIPVYPSIGNHDADETEERDDRAQVEDNFYLHERVKSEEAAGRASFGPGLFYRFRYGSDIEFVCIDTSKESFFRGYRLFEFPKHWEFVEQSFPAAGPHPTWRIPFAHHPVYSAGPQHHNTRSMRKLLPLFERSNVHVMFSGHEHNFQHSRTPGFDHFVTGAAGKLRRARPDGFEDAHTVSWATECHFLLGHIEGRRMTVRAIGAMDDPAGTPEEIARAGPDGRPVSGPIEITV